MSLPTTTTAIRFARTGGPEVLECLEIPLAAPRPGEALLRNTAIGVNFIEVYHRSGTYPVPLPALLGNEAASVVEAVGEGVRDVKPGDRVVTCSGPRGAYARFRVVPADRLVPLPREIDDETAAAAMLKGMTVEYLIRRSFPVRRGQTVLLHAAAGGVGLIACQWLKALGATVIGTVGSEEKAALARAHGCNHAIVYSRDDFVGAVRELTGGAGVPVVFDSVGRSTFLRSLDCLTPRGTLVLFGNASGKPEPFDPMLLSSKGSLFLTRPSLHDYVHDRTEMLAAAAALFDVLRTGAVKVRPSRSFPLARAADAHRAIESRATTGSTILIP
ncbi:MAG: quinone oxidoreductase [Planctomycetes bacterium]|nr:quinone oxidoreductase [Planctomycetota bacterium]